MLPWKVAGVFIALFVVYHVSLAQEDYGTYFVSYRSDASNMLERLRLMIEDLNQELKENINITKCGENHSLCVTSSQCRDVGRKDDNADCSVLVYKHDPQKIHSNTANQTFDNDNRIEYVHEYDEATFTTSKPSSTQVWIYGILAVGIISLSGLFGAVFWPIMKSKFYAQLMWILIGLAVGSLTATSTFQLIPESFRLREFHPEYLNTALFMWLSIWLFYIFEALAKIFFNTQTASTEESKGENLTVLKPVNDGETGKSHAEAEEGGLLSNSATENGVLTNKNIPHYMSNASLHSLALKQVSHLHSHTKPGQGKKTATVAWMIIFGDGIHNFIDGMSIGVGFSKSLSLGTSISIAIACEEFPHELGDFAILINSGMSVKRALLYNFLSACTAFAGLILGILLGEIDASVYIFAFAGGLFLYIALTGLMPELNEMLAAGLKRGKQSALFVLLLQNLGIILGALILYAVTKSPIDL